MEAKTSSQQTRSQLECDGVPNFSSEPMPSSEDAFSYAIARTEKSGSNGQQQANARRYIKRRDMSAMCDSVRAPARKYSRCGSHEGERIGTVNRSIRAQELSVVEASEVDIVPAPARKKKIGA